MVSPILLKIFESYLEFVQIVSIEIIHYTSNQLAIHGLIGLIANDDGYSVKACSNCDELFSYVSDTTSLIVINDHVLGEDLKDLITDVRNRSIETPILLIADTSESGNVLKTLDLGVQGFLTKECGSDEIIHSIHSLIKGERFFCNNVLNILLDKSYIEEEEDCTPTTLSVREVEITQQIADGLTSKKIADKLFISPHTVQTHRKNIMRKLKVNSVSELVVYAMKAGLVEGQS